MRTSNMPRAVFRKGLKGIVNQIYHMLYTMEIHWEEHKFRRMFKGLSEKEQSDAIRKSPHLLKHIKNPPVFLQHLVLSKGLENIRFIHGQEGSTKWNAIGRITVDFENRIKYFRYIEDPTDSMRDYLIREGKESLNEEEAEIVRRVISGEDPLP